MRAENINIEFLFLFLDLIYCNLKLIIFFLKFGIGKFRMVLLKLKIVNKHLMLKYIFSLSYFLQKHGYLIQSGISFDDDFPLELPESLAFEWMLYSVFF
jgi:hypothetical protein